MNLQHCIWIIKNKFHFFILNVKEAILKYVDVFMYFAIEKRKQIKFIIVVNAAILD